ncbi:MAG TPA: DUF5011 domain-containing protein [Acholeplasma sp.]|nr:DUF5011 domain-containing protein [Acholeplasma sp.]
MFKKKMLFILMLLLGLSFSINVKANSSTFNINLNINNSKEVISSELNQMLSFNYDYKTGSLVIRNESKTLKTVSIPNSGTNVISFDLDHLVDIDLRDEPGFYNFRNLNLKNLVLEFHNMEGRLVDNDNTIYDLWGTFDITIIFKLKPAISGDDVVLNNIEKPYTIEQIKEIINLQAHDAYDGDLTNKIVVEKDNYSENKNIVGMFKILFSVTNSSKVKTTYELTVKNQDFDAPVIVGPNEKVYSYKENITIDNLKELFTVSDNYDETVTLNATSNSFKGNTVGTYEISLNASDKAGNKTVKKLKVSIIDDVNPVISDNNEGVIKINYNEKITNELLLFGLTAIDEIDGDLTNQIKVIENNIGKELKTYVVKYEVVDSSGNKTQYERTYEVISKDVPNFFVSNNVLTIEDVNKMTIDQLAELLSDISNISMKSYEVLVNEYEGNENSSGIYRLSLKIIDENNNEHIINRDINVFTETEPNIKSNSNVYIYVISTLVIVTSLGILIYRRRK